MPNETPPNETPSAMSLSADPVQAVPGTCPVCGRPAAPAAFASTSVMVPDGAAEGPETCGECGWVLRTPLRAGRIERQGRDDFAGRLSAARRAQAGRDGRVLDTELRAVIGGLRPRAVFTVIDITAEGVAVCAAYLDPLGAARVREVGRVTWTSALRTLPADTRTRHARLAHGLLPGAAGVSDDDVAGLLLRRLPPVRRDGLLVLCRPGGWRLPETVASALAVPARGATPGPPMPPSGAAPGPAMGARVVRISRATTASAHSLLAELAERTPPRYAFHLLTTVVDRRTGRVTIQPRRLLPADGAGGALTVRRPPGKDSETTLAIFAGPERLDRAAYGPGATPVALYSVPLPPKSRFRVRAVIDGPGRLRITEPADAVPHGQTWARVRARVPDRVPVPVLTRVDLICAVDMAGSPDAVRRRVEVVRDFLEFLGTASPDSDRAADGSRVGLVTCTDHPLGRRPGRREWDPVTRVHRLAAVRNAIARLDETQAASVVYPQRAPVEDLLHEALQLLRGSRAAGRLPLLLTVAGRLPHPPVQASDGPLPCPHRYEWESLMRGLIEGGTICRVVADTLPRETARASRAERADRAAWRGLGPGGQFTLKEADARTLAESFGVLPSEDVHIPLPLSGDPADVPDDPDDPA